MITQIINIDQRRISAPDGMYPCAMAGADMVIGLSLDWGHIRVN